MKGHILVVDDDRTFRLSTIALLGEEGHDVDGAGSAAEAIESIERGRYDLVVMDLRMPGLSGIDGVEILRKRGEGVPVLMISGFGTVDTAVRALHTGVDDFLTKPVEPEVLLERVASLIQRRPDAKEGAEESPGGIVGRSEVMKRTPSTDPRSEPAAPSWSRTARPSPRASSSPSSSATGEGPSRAR